MMEFKEGNEDLLCYSIKAKSSREIQQLNLLCWVEVQKGKNLFSQIHQFVIFWEEWLESAEIAFAMTAAKTPQRFYTYNR